MSKLPEPYPRGDQFIQVGRDTHTLNLTALLAYIPKGVKEGTVDNEVVINPTYTGTGVNSTEWDRLDPPTGTKGVAITMTTRIAVDVSGHRLIAFSRVITFDDSGCLYTISAETLQTVDTFNVCPEV